MARSADLLPPIGPPGFRAQEEHEAWVRARWAEWYPDGSEGEPRPCDCGFFEPVGLVTCTEHQRERCRVTAQDRLRMNWRRDRERTQRSMRRFPGPPHDGLGAGWCRWCGHEIINPKTGRRHATRTWCPDGGCLHEFNLHTRRETQLPYLLDRDGLGCRECGKIHGSWGCYFLVEGDNATEGRLKSWHLDGPASLITWSSPLEVDHVTALGLVSHLSADARRWFFSPENLQLLCAACHAAKTVEDVRKIKAQRAHVAGRAPALASEPVILTR